MTFNEEQLYHISFALENNPEYYGFHKDFYTRQDEIFKIIEKELEKIKEDHNNDGCDC